MTSATSSLETVGCEQTASELPTIKRDGYFYAGIACLVVAPTVMPLSLSIVPLLGFSVMQTAIVLGTHDQQSDDHTCAGPRPSPPRRR